VYSTPSFGPLTLGSIVRRIWQGRSNLSWSVVSEFRTATLVTSGLAGRRFVRMDYHFARTIEGVKLVVEYANVCFRSWEDCGPTCGERQEVGGAYQPHTTSCRALTSESGGAPWVTDAAWAGLTPDFLTLSVIHFSQKLFPCAIYFVQHRLGVGILSSDVSGTLNTSRKGINGKVRNPP
jgi:hypothetical protein